MKIIGNSKEISDWLGSLMPIMADKSTMEEINQRFLLNNEGVAATDATFGLRLSIPESIRISGRGNYLVKFPDLKGLLDTAPSDEVMFEITNDLRLRWDYRSGSTHLRGHLKTIKPFGFTGMLELIFDGEIVTKFSLPGVHLKNALRAAAVTTSRQHAMLTNSIGMEVKKGFLKITSASNISSTRWRAPVKSEDFFVLLENALCRESILALIGDDEVEITLTRRSIIFTSGRKKLGLMLRDDFDQNVRLPDATSIFEAPGNWLTIPVAPLVSALAQAQALARQRLVKWVDVVLKESGLTVEVADTFHAKSPLGDDSHLMEVKFQSDRILVEGTVVPCTIRLNLAALASIVSVVTEEKLSLRYDGSRNQAILLRPVGESAWESLLMPMIRK